MKDTTKSKPDSGAAKWQRRFSTAKTNQEQLFKRYADWYDAFNARINLQTMPWRSKPYMPIIAQQTWALVAKFSSMRPGFEVKIRDDNVDDDEVEQMAEKAKKKLQYDYDCPAMDEPMRDKIAACLIDACVTGTSIGKVVYKTKKEIKRKRIIDDETGYADLTKEKVYESIVGYNDFEPVNIFNVFVSPSTDRLNKGWLIIRDYIALSELKATNEAKGGKFYQNLDKISGKPSYGEFSTYNSARNRFMNDEEPNDDTVDVATVYECYEGDKICWYAESKDPDSEGWVKIRETKNYYWHGKWPIVKFHIKKRPFSFWGQGLAELTYRLQTIYNDVFAHYLDAWNLTNNPSFWTSSDNDVADYVIEPGSLISYNGQTPPTPIAFNEPNDRALEMIVGLLNQSIEGVTASGYATGMTSSSSDKTRGTATGILKLQDAAGDIIGYMRENFVNSLLQVGKMWHSNNQQFMQKPVSIVANVRGGKEVVKVRPKDLQGDAEVYVDIASMQPKSEEEKRSDTLALTQQLLALQNASYTQQQVAGTDPLYYNFAEMAEDIGDVFGKTSLADVVLTHDQVKADLIKKGEKTAQEAMNESMGYDDDANKATMQMVDELAQEGAVDVDELAATLGEDEGYVS